MSYKNYKEFFNEDVHDKDYSVFLKNQGFKKKGGGYEKELGYGIVIKVRLSKRTGDLSIRVMQGGEAQCWCKLHDFVGREILDTDNPEMGGGAKLERELRDLIPHINDII